MLNNTSFEKNLIESTACFTGHRPDKLGGWNLNNPTMDAVRYELEKLIEDLIVNHGITRFISGGAQGLDQVAFKRVHDLKAKYPHIQNIIAIPFEKQDDAWPLKAKQLYRKLLTFADEKIYVDSLEKYQINGFKVGDYCSPVKLEIRNHYMVDHSDLVIAVFDGIFEEIKNGKKKKSGTGNCIKYAWKHDKKVYRFDTLNALALDKNYRLEK